jgi:hypothetical protein
VLVEKENGGGECLHVKVHKGGGGVGSYWAFRTQQGQHWITLRRKPAEGWGKWTGALGAAGGRCCRWEEAKQWFGWSYVMNGPDPLFLLFLYMIYETFQTLEETVAWLYSFERLWASVAPQPFIFW